MQKKVAYYDRSGLKKNEAGALYNRMTAEIITRLIRIVGEKSVILERSQEDFYHWEFQ